MGRPTAHTKQPNKSGLPYRSDVSLAAIVTITPSGTIIIRDFDVIDCVSSLDVDPVEPELGVVLDNEIHLLLVGQARGGGGRGNGG